MKVLIAVEDKVYGSAIASLVAKHKWEPGTEFKVIHVAESSEPMPGLAGGYCCDAARELIVERERRDRALVSSVATAIQTQLPGAPLVEEELLSGRAKDVILEVAEAWPADMIILGSHGRRGVSKFLLGSVSLSVLSRASCSVMIVKLPHEDEKPAEQTTNAGAEKKQPVSTKK